MNVRPRWHRPCVPLIIAHYTDRFEVVSICDLFISFCQFFSYISRIYKYRPHYSYY